MKITLMIIFWSTAFTSLALESSTTSNNFFSAQCSLSTSEKPWLTWFYSKRWTKQGETGIDVGQLRTPEEEQVIEIDKEVLLDKEEKEVGRERRREMKTSNESKMVNNFVRVNRVQVDVGAGGRIFNCWLCVLVTQKQPLLSVPWPFLALQHHLFT